MQPMDACGANLVLEGSGTALVLCDCPIHSGRGKTFFRRALRALTIAGRESRKWAVPIAIGAPIAFIAFYPQVIADRIFPLPEIRVATIGAPVAAAGTGWQLRAKPSRHSYTMETAREAYFRNEVPYGAILYEESRRNGLAPELVAAVIETESNFHSRSHSGKNARGLMQIVPSTGRELSAGDLSKARDNIGAGAKYLRYLSRRYHGDTKLALAAYNAGQGNVARYNGMPPFPETRNYLKRVSTRKLLYQRHVARRYVRALRLSGNMAGQ